MRFASGAGEGKAPQLPRYSRGGGTNGAATDTHCSTVFPLANSRFVAGKWDASSVAAADAVVVVAAAVDLNSDPNFDSELEPTVN